MLENKQFHENEIWREIQGYEGLYAVSTKGRVMNLKSRKVLKNVIDHLGYENVDLKGKKHLIHRLVALAFLDNPNNLPQVDHRDENKGNNNVSNLRWVSASENMKHSIHQISCRINQLTLDGQFIRQWESGMQIQRELGYAQTHIIKCCKAKIRSAYGYLWSYADPSQRRKYNRPIAALTKDGDLIAEYKSAAEAARGLKISTTQIRNCLYGTYKSAHGLRFIYID